MAERKRGLIALLKTMKPLKERFPKIDDPVPRTGEGALTYFFSVPLSIAAVVTAE